MVMKTSGKKGVASKAPKKTTALAVKKQVQLELTKQLEVKYYRSNYGPTYLMNKTWMVQPLSQVPAGTTAVTRIGEYITPKSIEIRMAFYDGIPEGLQIRVVLFKVRNTGFQPASDTWTGWASGASNQFMITAGTTGSYLAQDFQAFDPMARNEGVEKQVTIVSDKWLSGSGVGDPAGARFVHIQQQLSGKLHFTPGYAAGADKGYYLGLCCYNCRVPTGAVFSPGLGNQFINPTLTPVMTVCQWGMTCQLLYTDD